MADTKMLKHGEIEIEVIPQSVVASHEVWNEYALEDGTLVKTKLVCTGIYKYADGSVDCYGNPMYTVTTQVVCVTEHARERPGRGALELP